MVNASHLSESEAGASLIPAAEPDIIENVPETAVDEHSSLEEEPVAADNEVEMHSPEDPRAADAEVKGFKRYDVACEQSRSCSRS
jgi:hypothetical protein